MIEILKIIDKMKFPNETELPCLSTKMFNQSLELIKDDIVRLGSEKQ